MTENADNITATDPGLSVLVALLRFHGIGADAEQLRHRFGTHQIGAQDMLRCAKELGLKARAYRTSWERLATTPLPGIAELRDGSFLLLGKVGGDEAIVQSPTEARPRLRKRADLEAVWDGQIILMTRRAGVPDLL